MPPRRRERVKALSTTALAFTGTDYMLTAAFRNLPEPTETGNFAGMFAQDGMFGPGRNETYIDEQTGTITPTWAGYVREKTDDFQEFWSPRTGHTTITQRANEMLNHPTSTYIASVAPVGGFKYELGTFELPTVEEMLNVAGATGESYDGMTPPTRLENMARQNVTLTIQPFPPAVVSLVDGTRQLARESTYHLAKQLDEHPIAAAPLIAYQTLKNAAPFSGATWSNEIQSAARHMMFNDPANLFNAAAQTYANVRYNQQQFR